MIQTIQDLWNGNVTPYEHCGAHDSEANKLNNLLERNREALSEKLTEAQREIFQKYTDCSDEYLLRMLELAFADGFVLGSRLMVEVLGKCPT